MGYTFVSGVSNTVVENVPSLPSGNGDRSYAVWLRTTDDGTQSTSAGLIMCQGSISAYHKCDLLLNFTNPGTIALDFQVGAVYTDVTNIADGEVHFICATYRALDGVRIYLDGVEQVTHSWNSFAPQAVDTLNNGTAIGFGGGAGLPSQFNGTLYNASVWNHALSGDEVQSLYNGDALTFAPLVTEFPDTSVIDPVNTIYGTTGDDNGDATIGGTGGRDLILGLEGDDWINSSPGNDTLNGGAGFDLIFYENALGPVWINNTGVMQEGIKPFTAIKPDGTDSLIGIEALHGSEHDDRLFLSANGGRAGYTFLRSGNDFVSISDGHWLVLPGSGDDTISGGPDFVGLSYRDDGYDQGGAESSQHGGIAVAFYDDGAGLVSNDGWGGVDSFDGVDQITASNEDDFIDARQSSHLPMFFGLLLGNDTLLGGGGDDAIEGGDGNDSLAGNGGNDSFLAGAGSDTISGGAGYDIVEYLGDTSNGFLSAHGLIVNLSAYSIAVDIGQGAGPQLVKSGTVLDGFGGTDRLAGIEEIQGTAKGDFMQAAAGGTNLWGHGGDDTLIGGDGQDFLTGGPGNDRMDGGGGTWNGLDYSTGSQWHEPALLHGVIVNLSSAQIAADIGLGTMRVNGGLALDGWDGTDQIANISEVRLSDLADAAVGGSSFIVLVGNMGNDTLTGGIGGSLLAGGAGADALFGGAGWDRLSYWEETTRDYGHGNPPGGHGVIINLSAKAISADILQGAGQQGVLAHRAIDSYGATDTLGAFEDVVGTRFADHIVAGSADESLQARDGNDTVIGGAGNDTISGEDGNDRLYGAAGDDAIYGGAGDDLIDDGTGSDTIDGGSGNDTFSRSYEGTDLSVVLGFDLARGIAFSPAAPDVAAEHFTSIENLRVSGGFRFWLIGDGKNNALIANSAGMDTIDGGTGNDSMSGGGGNDTYVVDAAKDIVLESAGGGADLVLASASYRLGAEVENLTLTGSSAISGTGNALKNQLTGNSAANTLSGGKGMDILTGGGGTDMLYGGVDAVRDKFNFNTVSDSAVGAAKDVVFNFTTMVDKIDLHRIDANLFKTGDQAFAFHDSTPAANAIWVSGQGSAMTINGDVNGDAIADFQIGVQANGALGAYDFML